MVLVGDGRGETTLRDKLINPYAPLPKEEDSTKGVEIDVVKYQFEGFDDQPFRVNIWDFAGQEKYQSIHQFFYTIVLFMHWLKMRVSKKLTLTNICKPYKFVVIAALYLLSIMNLVIRIAVTSTYLSIRAEYPFLKDAYRVNFATGRGLAHLVNAIRFHIQQLSHVGEELPKSWAFIRTELRVIAATKPFLTYGEYLELCAEQGLQEEERARRLSLIAYFRCYASLC